MTEKITSDLTVVGGGIPGVTAALSAARHGARVALVQDRAVLGGNISSECHVSFGGASSNCSYYARESGVTDEIKLRIYHANPRFAAKKDYFLTDDALLGIVLNEPNITLFLGCSVTDAATETPDGSIRIKSLHGYSAARDTHYEFVSPFYLDASGDGSAAAASGAEYRVGREARDEYGEALAPEKADPSVMGSCVLFDVGRAERPIPFRKPEFAYDLIKDGKLRYFDRPETGRSLPKNAGEVGSLWWLSYGGTLDTIKDSSEIDLELKKLVYGYFDYIKNSGRYPGSENLFLEWVAPFASKRESRRFLGDYVMTQNDISERRFHEDDISTGGWPFDCHDPAGIYGSDRTSTYDSEVKTLYNIPYRVLYSRNVTNLFLSGRIISASHVALGSMRIVGTLGAMAQAAGTAAALCVKYGCLPRDIYNEHIAELRETLVRDGQYIVGYREDRGLAEKARITASSAHILENLRADEELPLDKEYAFALPVEDGRLDSFELRLKNHAETPRGFRFEIWDQPVDDFYRLDERLFSGEAQIPAEHDGFVKLNVKLSGIRGKKAFVVLKPDEALSAFRSDEHMTGVPPFRTAGKLLFREKGCFVFRNVLPRFDAYGAKNTVNGIPRPFGSPNCFMAESGANESLTFTFDGEKAVSEVLLGFDAEYQCDDFGEDSFPASIIRDFDVSLIRGGKTVAKKEVRDNYLGQIKLSFDRVECGEVKIDILATRGASRAEIFSVKIF